MPDKLARQRVATGYHRRDNAFNNRFICQRNIAGTKTLAPAGNAPVSLDFYQMRAAFLIKLLRIAKFLGQLVLQNMADDFGYLCH